jgi:ubiquitin C-terminal hydrolase
LEHDFLQYLYADSDSNAVLQRIEQLKKEKEELAKEVAFLKNVINKIK